MKCLVIFFAIALIQRAKSENEVNKLQSRAFSSEEFSKVSRDWDDSSFSNSSEEVAISPENENFLRLRYCGISNATQSRIKGGQLAAQHQFPWMAALGYVDFPSNNSGVVEWECGGALITEKHVLTVAHCIAKDRQMVVRLGALDILNDDTYNEYAPGQDIFVGKIIPHEEYKTMIHDIGIVTLIRKISAPMVWPICLPVNYPSFRKSYAGKTVTVAGWGIKYHGGPGNPLLQFVTLKVFSEEKCREQFDLSESQNVMCLGDLHWKQNLCGGDSGSAAMYQVTKKRTIYYAVGLVSFSYTDCGTPGNLEALTEIFPYLDWIRKQISNN